MSQKLVKRLIVVVVAASATAALVFFGLAFVGGTCHTSYRVFGIHYCSGDH